MGYRGHRWGIVGRVDVEERVLGTVGEDGVVKVSLVKLSYPTLSPLHSYSACDSRPQPREHVTHLHTDAENTRTDHSNVSSHHLGTTPPFSPT
jgi:hypothetical protein